MSGAAPGSTPDETPDASAAPMATARAAMDRGAPLEALEILATLIEAAPAAAAPREEAMRALRATYETGNGLAPWDPVRRTALLRALLRHSPCSARPAAVPHAIAAMVCSDAVGVARAMAPALAAEARALLAEGDCGAEPAAALLALRPVLDGAVPETELRALHAALFPRMAAEEQNMLYNVMFHAHFYGVNRDEALEIFAPAGRLSEAGRGLRAHALLLLGWLSPAGRLPELDGPGLRAALERALAVAPDPSIPDQAAEREADLAAARALLIRHLDAGDDASWVAPLLGNAAVQIARAAATARAAAPDAPVPARIGLRAMQGPSWITRPWMALQMARARAGLVAPAQISRRPQVALCISGQLRGHERALATWRRAGLFTGAEVSVFVHAWRGIGRAEPRPERAALPFAGPAFSETWRRIALREGYGAMQARQPALFAALAEGNIADPEAIRALYGAREVVLEDDAAPEFEGWSNSRKMHEKIGRAHDLARAAAAADGAPWDLILRLRPDLPIRAMGFDWRDVAALCAARPAILAEKSFGILFGTPSVGDQLALGGPWAMDVYAAARNAWIAQHDAGVAHCLSQPRGHVTLAMTGWLGGVEFHRAPLRFGQLLEAELIPPGPVLAALERDAQGRDDAIDAELIGAARQDSLD